MLSTARVTRVVCAVPCPSPALPGSCCLSSELTGFALPWEGSTKETLSMKSQSCLVWGEAVSGFGISHPGHRILPISRFELGFDALGVGLLLRHS